jgi:hypothetical protein
MCCDFSGIHRDWGYMYREVCHSLRLRLPRSTSVENLSGFFVHLYSYQLFSLKIDLKVKFNGRSRIDVATYKNRKTKRKITT